MVKHKREEVQLNDQMLSLILNRLEILWFVVNPKIGKELLELKDRDRINNIANKNNENELNAENFAEKWKEIKAGLPSEFRLSELFPKKKFILPTFNRKDLKKQFGISVE